MDFDSLPDDGAQPQATPAPAAPQGQQAQGAPAPSFDDLQDDSEKYGGLGQQAIAGAEGLAKGVAGPLATGAERLLGVNPEDIAGRAEANPWTHGVAEGAGLVLPAIFTAGASAEARGALEAGSLGLEAAEGSGALAKAAGYTLPGVLGGAGKAAAAAAKSAEIGKAGQMAIKLGIEGGLFKVSDNASKMILGQTDPEAPVASLLAGVPAAALLGGGLGFAGGKIGAKLEDMAASKAANTTSQWLADLGSRFNLLAQHGGIEGTTEAAADQAQHLVDTVQAAVDGGFSLKRASIDKLTQNVAPEALSAHVQEVSDMLKGIPNALAKSGLMDDAIEEWQSKVGEGASAGDVFEASDHLKKQLQELASYEKKDVSIFAKPAIQAARGMADKMKVALENPDTWGEMGDFQKQLNGAYSEMQTPLKDFLSAATQKVGGEVQVDKGKLYNLFKQLGKGKLSADIRTDKVANFFDPAQKLLKTVGELHAAQGLESNIPAVPTDILDEMLKKDLPGGAKTAQWLFDSGQSAVGMAGSHAVGTVVGAAGGHPYLGYRAGETLYPLFKELGKKPTRWAVSGVLRALSSGEVSGIPQAINYAEGIGKGASRIEGAINNVFSAGGKEYSESFSNDQDREKLKKYVEDGSYNQQIQNGKSGATPVAPPPAQKFAHGGPVLAPRPHMPTTKPVGAPLDAMGKVSAVFPEQSMMLGAAKGRINNYLNSIRPQKIQNKLPFDEEMPNKEHDRSYNRALDIANNPLSVMDHIKKGTLEPEHVKHINELYPELTSHLQKKMTEKISEMQMKNEKPPHKSQQGMSLFMGAALDSNLTPQNIMAAQASFIKNGPAPGMGGAPKKSTEKLDNVANQYRTTEQSTIQRQDRTKV